jgi:ABC-type multidrug transport system fused ATPase/permease subunit
VTVSAFSIQIFFEWMAQFEEALAGVERLDEYLRRPLEPGASLPAAARFQIGTDPTPEMVTSAFGPHENTPRSVSRNESIRGCHLSVQGLSLRYSADGPLVLDDVSFDLKPGQVLGVVGRTGSGKSSLIQALFHLYPLSAGKILINGQTARLARLGRLRADEQEQADTVSLDAFREQIALVTQDPVLLSGTVRDNLDLASEHSDQELFRALRLVGLGDWANEQGLARVIEERGRNISTGERQLVALARALLRSAPLVVLDEATASVDPLAEQTMMAATREFFKGRTQIVVAHRLSTLEHCDLVIWLDQGKVRAFGERGQVLKDFTAADLSTAQAT